ncbi:MAG: MotA/TolQ/ExbB proton channel family protein [Deltaproteobacteria bacterium]|nr:MotA/TolQ/ExbB proton channel family protein [Candidatus Anaeroferrophillacea bacterium]
MDPGAALKTFIYLVSSSLLYPVLLLLSGLTLVTVVMVGSFFAEWLERARLGNCPAAELPARLAAGDAAAGVSHRVRGYVAALHRLRDDDAGEPAVENLLQDTTLRLWKSMDRLRILVRVAPSLGLIGTLIPMGTGLAALGQGDLTRLSADLVIAFTTTVVGLAIGTTAFFLYTVKRRWVEEDVKNMELATEMIAAGESAATNRTPRIGMAT